MEWHSDFLSNHVFFYDYSVVFKSGLTLNTLIDDLHMPDEKAVKWQIYHGHIQWRKLATPLFNQSQLLSSPERLSHRAGTRLSLFHKLS